MRYLLDTNIVSDLMKLPSGRVMRQIAKVGEDAVFTSVIVLAELEYGVEKNRSKRLREQLDSIRESLPVLPLEQPVEEHYAAIRMATERMGRTIGQNDLLIAACARSVGAVVVTDDRAFLEMPGVEVENWLRG